MNSLKSISVSLAGLAAKSVAMKWTIFCARPEVKQKMASKTKSFAAGGLVLAIAVSLQTNDLSAYRKEDLVRSHRDNRTRRAMPFLDKAIRLFRGFGVFIASIVFPAKIARAIKTAVGVAF